MMKFIFEAVSVTVEASLAIGSESISLCKKAGQAVLNGTREAILFTAETVVVISSAFLRNNSFILDKFLNEEHDFEERSWIPRIKNKNDCRELRLCEIPGIEKFIDKNEFDFETTINEPLRSKKHKSKKIEDVKSKETKEIQETYELQTKETKEIKETTETKELIERKIQSENDYSGRSYTPLGIAVFTSNVEFAELLFANNVDVNRPINLGNTNATPLMLAAISSPILFKRLIQKGADCTLKDAIGYTALDWGLRNELKNCLNKVNYITQKRPFNTWCLDPANVMRGDNLEMHLRKLFDVITKSHYLEFPESITDYSCPFWIVILKMIDYYNSESMPLYKYIKIIAVTHLLENYMTKEFLRVQLGKKYPSSLILSYTAVGLYRNYIIASKYLKESNYLNDNIYNLILQYTFPSLNSISSAFEANPEFYHEMRDNMLYALEKGYYCRNGRGPMTFLYQLGSKACHRIIGAEESSALYKPENFFKSLAKC